VSKAKQSSDSDDISLRDIADFIIRRKFHFILAAIFATAGGVYQRSQRPRYLTTATIQLHKSEQNSAQAIAENFGGMGGGGKSSTDAIENTKNFFVSEELYRRIAQRILELPNASPIEKDLATQNRGLISRAFGPSSTTLHGYERMMTLASYLVDATSADILSPETIRLSVRANSPETTITVVNLMAEEGTKMVNENNVAEFNQTSKFVRAKLANLEEEIKAEQRALVDIGKKMGLVLGSDLRSTSTPITKMRDELNDAKNEHSQRLRLIEELEKRFKEGQTGFDTVTKFEKLHDERKYWSAVIQARESALKRMEEKQRNSPNFEQDFQNTQRQIEFKYRFYGELKNQLLQIEMMEVSIGSRVRTMEAGSISSTLVSTRGKSYLIAALFAALIASIVTGLGLFLLESIHPTVNNRRDLESLPISYLGEVPDFELDRFKMLLQLHKGQPLGNTHQLWHQHEKGHLIESPETMIFKNVRSRMLHAQLEDGLKPKLFCITSARPSEGKSMISGNLACVTSALKKRTLLIDADLRCGGTTIQFGYDGKKGLSDFLHGKETDYKKFVSRHPLGLDVIGRGTQNHGIVEIFSDEKFKNWIAKIKKDYDYIIIDTSPVLAVPETAIVCKHADLVLMTIVQHATRIEEVKHAVEDLSFGESRVVGYVLNRCGALSKDTYFYGMKRPAA